MGQHKHNATALAAKAGVILRRTKEPKPLSEREAKFLERWKNLVLANRPQEHTDDHKCVRSIFRARKRVTVARLRQVNRAALVVIRERQKAARKAKAA